MLFNFANVLLILIGGFVFVAINLILSRFLQTRLPSIEKEMPYECGEEPIGDTRIKFNTRFYVIALIFLIFDVEVVFLFPWAVVFNDLGLLALVEMGIFLLILLVGLAYVWKRSDLDWVKYNVKYGRGRYSSLIQKSNTPRE